MKNYSKLLKIDTKLLENCVRVRAPFGPKKLSWSRSNAIDVDSTPHTLTKKSKSERVNSRFVMSTRFSRLETWFWDKTTDPKTDHRGSPKDNAHLQKVARSGVRTPYLTGKLDPRVRDHAKCHI